MSYIAAHALGLAAAEWTQGFVAEREWQADWLAERLGLAALPDNPDQGVPARWPRSPCARPQPAQISVRTRPSATGPIVVASCGL